MRGFREGGCWWRVWVWLVVVFVGLGGLVVGVFVGVGVVVVVWGLGVVFVQGRLPTA